MDRWIRSRAWPVALVLLALAWSLGACANPFRQRGREVLTAQDAAPQCDVDVGDDALVRSVVDRFDGDYDQVVEWLCGGETLDDVMLALQTSGFTGRPADEILAASKEVGWQAIWKGYDLPPAGVAGVEDAVPTPLPPAPALGQTDPALPGEQLGDPTWPETAPEPVAGSGAILWEGDRFLLVGRISRLEPENRAIQVRLLTEGSREAVYLVRLPEDMDTAGLKTGWWVRIRGERGEGAYLLAHEIELLFAGSPEALPAADTAAASDPALTQESAGWEEADGSVLGEGVSPPEAPAVHGDQAGDGDDGNDSDGAVDDDGDDDQDPPDKDKDEGKDKNEGKGKGKDKDEGKDKGKGKDERKGKGH